jgi:hypothetical protein
LTAPASPQCASGESNPDQLGGNQLYEPLYYPRIGIWSKFGFLRFGDEKLNDSQLSLRFKVLFKYALGRI